MTAAPGGPVLPGGRPTPPALGRDDVVAEILDGLRHGRRLVLEGPAGIGKTTTLGTVLARLRESGTTVLAGAPSETEQQLPYAALNDVLQPLKRYTDRLPAPQRSALAAVLSDTDPSDDVDDRAVAAAVVALVGIAARRSLVLAVDDAMWLDDSSARALTFALRRVAVPVVACVRTGEPVPLGLERDAHVLAVDPLAEASVCQMLEGRLGRRMPRATLERVAHESGGNPLLAWELSRAVLRLPQPPGHHDDLPLVDASISGLTAATLDDLPAPTIAALQQAALLTVPRVEDLVAAGARLGDLDPAVAVGIVVVDAFRVGFTHPVYATAVRVRLGPAERRALHQSLADAVSDRDERARQLARAHVDPDATVAEELADAAGRLRARGAQQAAADLFRTAAALTPAGVSARAGRLLAAARCLFDAFDLRAAADVVHDVLRTASGDTAAEAVLLLADACWYDSSLDVRTSYDIGAEALRLATPGSATEGRIHSHLAIFSPRPDASAEHAGSAGAIFAALPGHSTDLATALLAEFMAEARAGRPPRDDLLARALEIEGDTPLWSSGTVPAIWWTTLDQSDQALERLDWMLRHATSRGDEPWALEITAHLVTAELLAGRLDDAAGHLARLRASSDAADAAEPQRVVLEAELALRRGDPQAARDVIEQGGVMTERWFAWHRSLQLASLDLAAGRPADAGRTYADVAAALDASGVAEWQWQRSEPEWVEAACLAGDLDLARSAHARLAARHAALPRPWTRLGLARAELALARGSGGDVAAALDAAQEALAEIAEDAVVLDRGHVALAGGRAALDIGDPERARVMLRHAVAAYGRAGAPGRRAQTEAELEAVRAVAPDADDVRRALRDFHRPARLAANPLASGADDATRGEGLVDLVTRGVAETFGASADEQLLAAILEAAYLSPGAGHASAMRALHLSRTTYYRRLAEATERIATWVLDQRAQG